MIKKKCRLYLNLSYFPTKKRVKWLFFELNGISTSFLNGFLGLKDKTNGLTTEIS